MIPVSSTTIPPCIRLRLFRETLRLKLAENHDQHDDTMRALVPSHTCFLRSAVSNTRGLYTRSTYAVLRPWQQKFYARFWIRHTAGRRRNSHRKTQSAEFAMIKSYIIYPDRSFCMLGLPRLSAGSSILQKTTVLPAACCVLGHRLTSTKLRTCSLLNVATTAALLLVHTHTL